MMVGWSERDLFQKKGQEKTDGTVFKDGFFSQDGLGFR